MSNLYELSFNEQAELEPNSSYLIKRMSYSQALWTDIPKLKLSSFF